MDIENLTKEQKLALLDAIEEHERRQRENKLYYTFPEVGECSRDKYPKQMEFFKAGVKYHEVAFIAGNRTGKSHAGAYEAALHATGLYPEWWPGRRFERPVQIWAAGSTNETTRDIIQAKLIGPVKTHYGEGMLPKDLFTKPPTTRAGIPDAVQDIYIRHISGGISKITLKSYQQGRQSFEGADVDYIWLDEEPSDPGIYTECLTRTATTKGLIKCTFTPLMGLSDVVLSFLPDGQFPENGIVNQYKYVVNMTWNDCPPHLPEEEKERIKASYLPHELEARTRGLPALGAGRIYPVSEEDIAVSPFKIPSHWPVCFGMDVGWNKTAVAWVAVDPNTDTVYLYDEYYRGQAEPAVHVSAIQSRGSWIYGAIDWAGLNPSNGERLIHQYSGLGLNVFPANKAVDAGLLSVYRRMTEGRFKVFKTCMNWLKEFRVYRRDDKGNIVKNNDHLMDATRYVIYSGLQAAQTIPSDEDDHMTYRPREGQSDVTGY